MTFIEWLSDFVANVAMYDEQRPLIFSRYGFLIFFTVLFGGYLLVFKKINARNVYLLAFSLFFYWKAGGFYFLLLLFSTVVDYVIGKNIYDARTRIKQLIPEFDHQKQVDWDAHPDAKEERKRMKQLVTLSVIINLGVLAYFKYAYLTTGMINEIFGTDFRTYNAFAALANVFGGEFSIWEIILPVGISFYTFQTISYSVDIYRGHVEPVKNIWDFGFYVTFFPQLVAGPIVRASEFVPQIYQPYKVSREEFGHAMFLIFNGLIKKVMISDYISINFVDRVFADPLAYTGFENLMAAYGYTIQIYCDFSGYTDMAIGLALLLGFRLPLNFNSPYKAINITDFWRRWHISLSSWLRDYLYIPLGGSRQGKVRTYINLMLTMLLGGLWHGAAITFIIWGGLHGVALAIHKMWMKTFPPQPRESLITKLLAGFFTFHFLVVTWMFFRVGLMRVPGEGLVEKEGNKLQKVLDMLSQIFTDFRFSLIGDVFAGYKWVFIIMLIGFGFHWLPGGVKAWYEERFKVMPYPVMALIAFLIILFLYQIKSSDIQPFIYFQF